MKKIVEVEYQNVIDSGNSDMMVEEPSTVCQYKKLKVGGLCWKTVALPYDNDNINIPVDCKQSECGIPDNQEPIGSALSEDKRVYKIWESNGAVEHFGSDYENNTRKKLSTTEILLIILAVVIIIQLCITL